jgi:hypothetical protein
MDNLSLWNKVCTTLLDSTKNFKGKGGFQGTAICEQSQRKKATEIFGPFGIGWGVTDETFNTQYFDQGEGGKPAKLFYTATLFYTLDGKKGSFPISADIDVFSYNTKYKSWSMGNDVSKKVRTDAMTKGLSELGFNSDIFEGKFDDNKYIQALEQEQYKKSFDRQKQIDLISDLVKTKTLTDSDKAQIKSDIKKAKSIEDFDIIYANIEGM